MGTSGIKRPYLVFALGEEAFAVPAEQVRELVAAAALTPLPGAPTWVRGVFNLRGSVVPLVDLAAKLGAPSGATTARTSWVVVELLVERRRHVLAFVADEVREILELEDGEVLETPPTGILVDHRCVRGVVRSGDRFGLLLDLDRVLGGGGSPAADGGAAA
jgi:purine-binding chemotaxis protein CheW